LSSNCLNGAALRESAKMDRPLGRYLSKNLPGGLVPVIADSRD